MPRICRRCRAEAPEAAARCDRCDAPLADRWALTGAARFALLILAVEISALAFLWLRMRPAFASMYADFASVVPLPTRVVLQGHALAAATFALAGCGVWAFAIPHAPRRRERVLVVAAGVGLLALAAGLWALYQPLFALADHVGA